MSSGNWKSLKELIKRQDPVLTGSTEKTTQKESQKIAFILPVLNKFLTKSKTSAVCLTRELDISRDSIDRTIHLLLEKNLIKFKEYRARGEKIYAVSSQVKLEKYEQKLKRWKSIKKFNNVFSSKKTSNIRNYIKSLNNLNKFATRRYKIAQITSYEIPFDEFINTPIRFRTKEEHKRITGTSWSNLVKISDLGVKATEKIIDKYRNNTFCPICFRNARILVDIIHTENELVCTQGHVSPKYYFDNPDMALYTRQHEVLPKIKKRKLTDKQIKKQAKYLINKK